MDEQQLKAKYRELVIKMHPDKNCGDKDATAKFQEMQEQYEERLAELHGDYTKSARGRARRESEWRERQERERKEREQRKFEEVINQARLNKGKDFHKLKVGDYIYARKVNYEATRLTACADLLREVLHNGIADETVVKIETICELSDESLMWGTLSDGIEGIFGGWETIQQANPMGGVRKKRNVGKVVMFRSKNFCLFGNPMGDPTISDYYLPVNYEEMFSDRLHIIQSEIERERLEQERKEAERKAKLLAEQQPMIDEWKDKLITISAALSITEREQVAIANLKTMLKVKFPGVKFRNADGRTARYFTPRWEDGPTTSEVRKVIELFDPQKVGEQTPWVERFGVVTGFGMDRRMSAITKATILQQLGEIADAFSKSGYYDTVCLSAIDWQMLHLMAGVNVYAPEHPVLCDCDEKLDGTRMVQVSKAVRYVFDHTSYGRKAKKKAAKAA